MAKKSDRFPSLELDELDGIHGGNTDYLTYDELRELYPEVFENPRGGSVVPDPLPELPPPGGGEPRQ